LIELARIVEHQAVLYGYRATQNAEHAQQLEALIEATKPPTIYSKWHPLIATPFRYSPPHPNARFRPPYGKNVFYAAMIEETALYEHAFYFIKERMQLPIESQTGTRTLFFISANDNTTIKIKDQSPILDKHDYSASHQFVIDHPEATFIIYPSCRDPKHRNNAAILNIHHLQKIPTSEVSINFFYSQKNHTINWLDYKLPIRWDEIK
jgi:hypothetical protein